MPTPESEMFLAKKPKVAPTFAGVDYEDNTALKAAQDAIIREQWVKSMMARLVREEMGKCYRREGVNHLEKCGPLRGKWFFVGRGRGRRKKERPGAAVVWAGLRRKCRQLGVWLHRSLLTEAAERYFELLKDAKVKGYLFAQQNYVDDGLSKQ
jgi:hypothetical protein